MENTPDEQFIYLSYFLTIVRCILLFPIYDSLYAFTRFSFQRIIHRKLINKAFIEFRNLIQLLGPINRLLWEAYKLTMFYRILYSYSDNNDIQFFRNEADVRDKTGPIVIIKIDFPNNSFFFFFSFSLHSKEELTLCNFFNTFGVTFTFIKMLVPVDYYLNTLSESIPFTWIIVFQ